MASRAYVAAYLLNVGFFVISTGLTIACVILLTREKAFGHQSRLLRRGLLGYVVLIDALAFTAVVWNSKNLTEYFHYLTLFYIYGKQTGPVKYFESDILRPILPLTLWCAEAFMIWRLCLHIRSIQRPAAFSLGCLTIALGIIVLVSGIPILTPKDTFEYHEYLFNYRFFAVSAAAVNIIISGMIAARLIIWDRVFRGIDKTWISYSKAILRVLIASGTLLTLVSVLAGSFFNLWVHDWMIIPILVMPQICAISTLLIVCYISHCADSPIRLVDSPLPEGAEFSGTEDA